MPSTKEIILENSSDLLHSLLYLTRIYLITFVIFDGLTLKLTFLLKDELQYRYFFV